MSLLNTKFNGTLTEGTHNMKFVNLTEIEGEVNTNGQAVKNSYVVVEMVTDEGMPVKINMFEKQLGFMVRDLINAYYPGKSMTVLEVVSAIGSRYIPVTKYTSQGRDRSFVNYSFNPNFKLSSNDEYEQTELTFA